MSDAVDHSRLNLLMRYPLLLLLLTRELVLVLRSKLMRAFLLVYNSLAFLGLGIIVDSFLHFYKL